MAAQMGRRHIEKDTERATVYEKKLREAGVTPVRENRQMLVASRAITCLCLALGFEIYSTGPGFFLGDLHNVPSHQNRP